MPSFKDILENKKPTSYTIIFMNKVINVHMGYDIILFFVPDTRHVIIELIKLPDGLHIKNFNAETNPDASVQFFGTQRVVTTQKKIPKQHEPEIYFKLFDIFAKELRLANITLNADNNPYNIEFFKKYGFIYGDGEFEKKVDDTTLNYFIEINENIINIGLGKGKKGGKKTKRKRTKRTKSRKYA
jgi:hypothetical protein